MRRLVFPVVLGGSLLVSGSAGAWDTPEHTSFGNWAFAAACAATGDKLACSDSSNQSLAGTALAQPDFCHSFWYSDVAISLNDDDASERTHCAIRWGSPVATSTNMIISIGSGIRALDQSVYALITNSNHFGDNTHTHFTLFHQIALSAARLRAQLAGFYKTPPNSEVAQTNPLLNVCTRGAVAIEGYSLHYLTDRAAAGHAWNPEPRYTPVALEHITMSGLRSCIHGQDHTTKVESSASTGFNCVDSLLLANQPLPIFEGLGDTGRAFGGNFWGQGLWKSDSTFSQAPSQQSTQVNSPAEEAFEELLNELNGNAGTNPPWTDTFVSNQDFCRVTLSECCRSVSSSSLGTCSACTPDITDSQLKSLCPVDHVQSSAVSGTSWVPIAGGLIGSSLYYAHMSMTGSGLSGINVAQTLAHVSSPSTTHPDATWDQSNDIVTRLGCEQFDIKSANLPNAPLDGTPVTAAVTYGGNPKFPLTVHWRANTNASQGAVCKAPGAVPDLCSPQDYVISDRPSGATALSPAPLSISDWVCPGTGPGVVASAPGYLYITDANGSWTPAYPATAKCGDASQCSQATPVAPSGGVVLACSQPMQLLQCPGDGGMMGICGGEGAQCCGGGACPNVDGQCLSCGGSFTCLPVGCPVPSNCSATDGG